MLPGADGFDLCRQIRQTPALSSTPIIFLTAKTAEADRVKGLELGGDDYITKPFSPRELLARLRVSLRHSNPPVRESEVTFDNIVVNFERMEVTRNGTSIALTAREFKTLRFFLQNPDRIITRAELLNKVWGNESGDTATRTIDNHIMKLRQKLEDDPIRPIHFRTVHGFGYRFAF
jgi:DNA-binding response OmpR family regulator